MRACLSIGIFEVPSNPQLTLGNTLNKIKLILETEHRRGWLIFFAFGNSVLVMCVQLIVELDKMVFLYKPYFYLRNICCTLLMYIFFLKKI